MKKRIITSAVLIPLLLLILYVAPKWATGVLFALISGLAAFELTYSTGLVKHPRLVAYCVLAAVIVPLWCQFGMNPVWPSTSYSVRRRPCHSSVTILPALRVSEY